MAAFSDFLEAAILNSCLRNTAFPAEPANVYIALYTSATTDAGGGTEVSGSAYARKAVSTTGQFNAPGAGGSTANTNEIAFAAAAGGNWGTCTHFAIWNHATAGDQLFHGALTASKVVNDGDIFRFAAGALVITLA